MSGELGIPRSALHTDLKTLKRQAATNVHQFVERDLPHEVELSTKEVTEYMASKQTYPCFACRKVGFEVPVLLGGNDDQDKTKYLNEDGTKHIHKTKEQLQPSRDFEVPEESVQKGITTFTMMTALIRLVEQNQKELVTLNEKVDYLTELVYALSLQQQN
jgi:hypothetical protein